MQRLALPNTPDELTLEHLHQIGNDILKNFPAHFPRTKRHHQFSIFPCLHKYPTKASLYEFKHAKKLANYPIEHFTKEEGWSYLVNLMIPHNSVKGIKGSCIDKLGVEINEYLSKAWRFQVKDDGWKTIRDHANALLNAISSYPFKDQQHANIHTQLHCHHV